MKNLLPALLVLLALVIPFVLCWHQSRESQRLLLQEIAKSQTSHTALTQNLINYLRLSSKQHSETEQALLNRLQAHNWQEYVVLQENLTTRSLENLQDIDEDEIEDQVEVLNDLFDAELAAEWKVTND